MFCWWQSRWHYYWKFSDVYTNTSRKKERFVSWDWIDIRVKPDGYPKNGDINLFANSDPRKQFPVTPTCRFRGKKNSYFVRWNESGSILNIVERYGNQKLFLFLDIHSSCFEIPFLKYINTPEDHWVVCLGVPYGTALWQVGDSEEQNEPAKKKLLDFMVEIIILFRMQCSFSVHYFSLCHCCIYSNSFWYSEFMWLFYICFNTK